MKRALIAAVAAGSMVAAAPAQGAIGTYAGKIPNTPGVVAMDVKIKRGFVTKIIELRGDNVPSNCEVSGSTPVNFDLPTNLTVNQQTAKFAGTYTQPTYGNQSTLKGTFFGRTVKGKLRWNYHYQAEGDYPEENCDTGVLKFKASLDNPDQTTASRLPR